MRNESFERAPSVSTLFSSFLIDTRGGFTQTVKEGRRQGRQKKSLEDNIREWTDLEFAKSQRAVENREKWRK